MILVAHLKSYLILWLRDISTIYLVLEPIKLWNISCFFPLEAIVPIVKTNTKVQGNLFIYWSVHNWLLWHNYRCYIVSHRISILSLGSNEVSSHNLQLGFFRFSREPQPIVLSIFPKSYWDQTNTIVDLKSLRNVKFEWHFLNMDSRSSFHDIFLKIVRVSFLMSIRSHSCYPCNLGSPYLR